MKLNPEERNALVMLRIQKAKETLQDAKEIAAMKKWRAAANRLYYLVIMLLLKYEFSVRTHSGVIGLLGIHFVSKGIINKEHGKFYGKLFELRKTGDYDDWMTIDAEDVLLRLEPAQKFIDEIEYLITKNT